MTPPQSRRLAAWLLVGLVALSVSCEEPDFETHIELIVAAGQQPLAGASSVEVEVRYPDGDNIVASLSTSSGDQAISGLRPGSGVIIEVTALSFDGEPVGLGRSIPVTIGEEGTHAAVFLGEADTLARFPEAATTPRAYASFVALSRDRIVAIGGGDFAGSTVASTELFGSDPLAPLEGAAISILERIGHQALWIPRTDDGSTDEWQGQIAVIGGTTGSDDDTWEGGLDNAQASVALVDPESGAVELNATTLNSGVVDARIASTEAGLIALVGGLDDDGAYRSTVDMIRPGEGFTVPGPTIEGREMHQLTALEHDGPEVYAVTGGLGASGLLDTIEYWDGRQTSDFTPPFPGAALQVARARHQATFLESGHLLVTGGATGLTSRGELGSSLASAELIDVDLGTVSLSTDSLDVPRQRHVAVAIPRNRVLICAGIDSSLNTLGSCEVYDAETDSFSGFLGGSMNPGGPGVAAASFPDGRVFFLGGGSSNGADGSLYVYTPPQWQD